MNRTDWTRLRSLDLLGLREARLKAHHALQWLAKAARAYVPPQADDSHTNLGWSKALCGFATHPFKNGAWLGLRMTDLTLVFHGGQEEADLRSFPLDGRTDAQAGQWLRGEIAARGLDAAALDARAPYQVPDHAVTHGAPYNLSGIADMLAELAAWFGNAQISLGSIRDGMLACKLAASPVRCWPHHFDLATLIALPAPGGADESASVGAGLSPGDEYYDEPYFYVSVYPEPDPGMLPTLPMLGHWHDRDFIAAVAPAQKIVVSQDQQAETQDFLRVAIDHAIKVLS